MKPSSMKAGTSKYEAVHIHIGGGAGDVTVHHVTYDDPDPDDVLVEIGDVHVPPKYLEKPR